MGIIKISDLMHENLRKAHIAFNRSINAQADHWMRVGMLSELYPSLHYTDILHLLLQNSDNDDNLQSLVEKFDAQKRIAS